MWWNGQAWGAPFVSGLGLITAEVISGIGCRGTEHKRKADNCTAWRLSWSSRSASASLSLVWSVERVTNRQLPSLGRPP